LRPIPAIESDIQVASIECRSPPCQWLACRQPGQSHLV